MGSFLRKAQRARSRAFTLIEMLVVVAIIGILGAFVVTGFHNIATSHGVGQAAADVKGILELARSEAVTRQTYVWAAFREATNSGILEIQMALAGSVDGSPNAAATNLVGLSRVVRARNAGLTNFSTLKAETRALLGSNAPAPTELLGNTAGITYTNLAQSKFTNTTITFTPRGEAMLVGSPNATSGFTPLIVIGIVPSRGDQKDTTKKDDSAVVLDGSTGMSLVLRSN
jgi:prepilin-type N-terminal cleavage/methylation domain-containing protein